MSDLISRGIVVIGRRAVSAGAMYGFRIVREVPFVLAVSTYFVRLCANYEVDFSIVTMYRACGFEDFLIGRIFGTMVAMMAYAVARVEIIDRLVFVNGAYYGLVTSCVVYGIVFGIRIDVIGDVIPYGRLVA